MTDELIRILSEIVLDLKSIKKRLGIYDIVPDPDQDQDQDQDQDRSKFYDLCKELNLDLKDFDWEQGKRAVRYFMANQWRISSKRSYIEKIIDQNQDHGKQKKPASKDTTGGFKNSELTPIASGIVQADLDWYLKSAGAEGAVFPRYLDNLTEKQRLRIAAFGIKKERWSL